MPANSNETVGKIIVGMGRTGLSCARFLATKEQKFIVVDSSNNPPALAEFKALFPDVTCHLGGLPQQLLLEADELIVSPGVGLATKEIAAALAAGVPLSGDIDLFSREVESPIVAVTGSNGKSTVVALVAHIFAQAGISFGLGGNFDGANSKPALDLLPELNKLPELSKSKKYYILELSSFQLETTARLGADVAVILNLSADHMDRYDSMASYLSAKQKIFAGARNIVVNRDESASAAPADTTALIWDYGMDQSSNEGFGLIQQDGQQFLAQGSKPLMGSKELKLAGRHNVANALAAMAIATATGIDIEQIVTAVKNFSGLPHRCQWVAKVDGVDYYNDSKGTNVGATMAALEGLAHATSGSIVLIAGGLAKGADFSALAPIVKQRCKNIILIGADAPLLAAALAGEVEPVFVDSLEQAVLSAHGMASPGDAVLLSPACASFDMFKNFMHRGQVFMQAVGELQ